MAKVLIENDAVDIRVSLLERVMLSERPRKVPLSKIRRVDPHPPLLDMMMHWSDQSGVWLCGVSSYEGHMIPSARNPGSTIAIEVEGDERERIYVEVDDESPAHAAERISRALHGDRGESTSGDAAARAADAARDSHTALMNALDVEVEVEDEDDVRLRDPLMQGSLPPPAMYTPEPRSRAEPRAAGRTPERDPERGEPAHALQLDDDRDLGKLGGWLVALGTLGLLTGGIMLASGALPGLLALGAGGACAMLGGVALAVVAHHQG
jgi:hypothetical protein